MEEKKICPICGMYEYEEEYDICPICGWEYDPVQDKDHDYVGGANDVSINQAKHYYNIGRSITIQNEEEDA